MRRVKNRDEKERERERKTVWPQKTINPKSGTTLCLNGRQTKEEEMSPEKHTHTEKVREGGERVRKRERGWVSKREEERETKNFRKQSILLFGPPSDRL